MKTWLRGTVAVALACAVSACAASRPAPGPATPSVPRFAEYPLPEIPAGLVVADDVRSRHLDAWARLQAGDLRTASREFSAILKQTPSMYPAETGLGFVLLAGQDYGEAAPRFAAAVVANDGYLPAWVGRAEALVGLGQDDEAIRALERVLALDPAREAVRPRLELLRVRLTQSALGAGQQARAAGRHDEAVAHFERALAQAPDSTMILNELTRGELAAGRLDRAEAHARRALAVEPREADWQALLGDVLEARGLLQDAAEAYGRAELLEPSDQWRTRLRELRERAVLAALPASFRAVTSAETVTRADVAAYIGIHLRDIVEGAPVRVTTVATDVRTHWAAAWILPVTRAGIMAVFPNHTFQPATVVRRGDLATVMATLVPIVGATRQSDLTTWQAARPQFVDLPPSHVFYAASALAAAAGVMNADDAGRVNPTAPATGADLERAVQRIAALAGR